MEQQLQEPKRRRGAPSKPGRSSYNLRLPDALVAEVMEWAQRRARNMPIGKSAAIEEALRRAVR